MKNCMVSPKVSIGIPAFNRANFLPRTIDSVRQQTYTNLEILISDNASTDGTEAYCRTVESEDSRIVYIRQPQNFGVVNNFNFLKDLATGDFFMWLGDDDWLDLDYIEKCVITLQTEQELVLVSGMPRYYKKSSYKFNGRLFNINHLSPHLRLQHYYGRVTDNGVFYGVYRMSPIRDLKLSDVLAGDWHFVAEALVAGGSQMLATTAIHREQGGASESYSKLIEMYGLPKFAIFFPSLYVANSVNVFLQNSTVYKELRNSKILRGWIIVLLIMRPITNLPFRILRRIKLNLSY